MINITYLESLPLKSLYELLISKIQEVTVFQDKYADNDAYLAQKKEIEYIQEIINDKKVKPIR